MGAMSRSRWPRSLSHGICSPTFCGSSRNFDRRQSHQPRKAFVRYASEPNSRKRCASMTENSAIFNARHGAGSFHPHRQLAPTAQDCLKRGNGANWRTTRQLSGECRPKFLRAAGTPFAKQAMCRIRWRFSVAMSCVSRLLCEDFRGPPFFEFFNNIDPERLCYSGILT
jgi:hypothetical protein